MPSISSRIPESDLYRFGSETIGYDCYRGVDVPLLAALEANLPDWRDLTREPRTYGFHATLKAPFRLAHDASERDLRATLDRLALEFDAAPAFVPQVGLPGTFAAIVPSHMSPALSNFADACVRAFEPFRAPLLENERQRRIAAGLDAIHIANLDRWGYPYVFNEFRFHMTLTGRLPPGRRGDIRARLSRLVDEVIGIRPIVVDRLALLRQAGPESRFEVVRVAPVGCAMGD